MPNAVQRRMRSECLADFIELVLNTGRRKGELLDLAWDWEDLGHRLVPLSATDNKSGKQRTVPTINAARAASIRRWGSGRSIARPARACCVFAADGNQGREGRLCHRVPAGVDRGFSDA